MRKLLVFGVLCALSTRSFADDRATARHAAEQLAADARTMHDDAKYVACGQAYLDLYNHDPQAADNDEILYNAAVCFREAKSVSAQLQSYKLLLEYFPRSKLAGKALVATALAYAQIAYFDRAAEHLEEYAAKYAGEKDAIDALSDAVYYRAALGDTAKRVQDTRLFIRNYGSRRPKEAAAAHYALLSAYDGAPDDAIRLLREYLKSYRTTIDDDQAIAAHARLGALLWAQSCPVPATDGLCITFVRKPPALACGADRVLKVVAVTRSAVRAEALAESKQAIALFEKAPTAATPRGRHAAAMAKLALADDDLERMLEASLPTDLDFDPAPAHKAARDLSLKRFTSWIERQTASGRKLADQYSAILQLKDADSSIAAAARIGQTAQAFWRALLVGEIPKTIRTGDLAKAKLDAYCHQIREVAEPLAARAVEAFALCLAKASELAAGESWAPVCLRELHVLAPDKFPDVLELRAAPELVATPVALEPPTR